ncbi:MAG TPA: phosphate ABC transporter substrate-binding protein PstS [Nitrososphaerales archaeon]|nr:phosphate ABC transporter substrate-binding protein PstS [Nitrososphaerales archaeon]
MRLSKKSAISSTVTAAVVIVVILLVVAVIYITKPFGSQTSTTTSSTQTWTPLTLQAGGSSFVNPVMQVWAAGFSDYTSGAVKTNYQAIGSGAGITGILKGTFDFAGSDAPVSPSVSSNYTAANGPLLQIPETLGAVALFYNIPGVKANLNLTGPIIADIYLQKITLWNDPAIRAINPKVADLNATKNMTIIPVHRSDGSGTTYALTNYFTKVSGDWNASGKGFGTSINWPASGELGGKGSAGVAADVSQNPYAIGYADSYYAFSNKLLSAAIQNKAGNFVQPSLAGVTSAAADFAAQVQTNPTFSITNAPGSSSYPISTYTYLLVWQNQASQGKGYDVAQLFLWIVTHGQSYGPPLFYPTLPASVVAIDQSLIAKVNYNGTPFIQTG